MLLYPLLSLSAAFIAGILLGKVFNLPWLAWAIAGSIFLLFSIFDRFARLRFTALQRLRGVLPVAPALISAWVDCVIP